MTDDCDTTVIEIRMNFVFSWPTKWRSCLTRCERWYSELSSPSPMIGRIFHIDTLSSYRFIGYTCLRCEAEQLFHSGGMKNVLSINILLWGILWLYYYRLLYYFSSTTYVIRYTYFLRIVLKTNSYSLIPILRMADKYTNVIYIYIYVYVVLFIY